MVTAHYYLVSTLKLSGFRPSATSFWHAFCDACKLPSSRASQSVQAPQASAPFYLVLGQLGRPGATEVGFEPVRCWETVWWTTINEEMVLVWIPAGWELPILNSCVKEIGKMSSGRKTSPSQTGFHHPAFFLVFLHFKPFLCSGFSGLDSHLGLWANWEGPNSEPSTLQLTSLSRQLLLVHGLGPVP